jgi:hypothetical protein
MNNDQLTAYLQDESYLYTLSYEELKTLVVQYPYAANLRILLLKKSHLDQNKDYDRHLQMAAAYSTNRRFLYKLVKKLKTLQAVPENVILAEDYLELTELSNIEKILSTRQPAEALATAENTRTLSADFNLNFEPPTHTPEDDDALFNLAPNGNIKPDLNFMTDEEVDFLVDDIVSKFKNPAETVLPDEKMETDSIPTLNGHEKHENIIAIASDTMATEGVKNHKDAADNLENTHNTPINTHFFDDNDDQQWAVNAKEDKVIEDEILKLDVFNQPPPRDVVERIELVSHTETVTDFQPLETTELVSHEAHIEDFQPVEKADIVAHLEPIEDFKPVEIPSVDYVLNQNVSSEMQDLYYTTFLPLLPDEPTIGFIEEVKDSKLPDISVEKPMILDDITDISKGTPVVSQKTPVVDFIENIEPKKTVSTIANEGTHIYKSIEDFIETKQSNIVVTKRTIIKAIEDLKDDKKEDKPVSTEKPNYSVIEDFTKNHASKAVISNETPVYKALEDLKDIKASEHGVSNGTSHSALEDFMDNRVIDAPVEMGTLSHEILEEGDNHLEDKSVSMGYFENPDLLVKKKDNAKPLIELEIVNQSKATLVDSTTTPSVSDSVASFSEWLQQFQKPKPSDIAPIETVKNEPKEQAIQTQDIDNQANSPKNKQRKYHLDNLTELFEANNGLPDNLFYGLSAKPATDSAPNIVEKQENSTPIASDTLAILDGFLKESAAAIDDKDLEWLSIPVENKVVTENIEQTFSTEKEAYEQGENDGTEQTDAPQKKKKKKMMHELAAKSLETDYEIISEPLADIYAAQGLIDKAIEMYQRLSLHIPEKSDFFAAKIEKLRITT